MPERNQRILRSHAGVLARHCRALTDVTDWATVMTTSSLVSVVDDDESVRESLPDMLRQFGFAAQAFSSAEAFLASESSVGRAV